ncbi:MAG: 50S ribosomal protein L29 [Dehalococcoidia bacterium]|nr:50S ribosomal protein L29 [Dehalococcoidia bacterium]MBL7166023.1 50S ribosomal protein L29 [Dehalococcoidales bacterium]
MKVEEIRALSTGEIVKQVEAAHQELFDLRFRAATKQLVNHREIPRVRRNIARMEMVLRERVLATG